MRRADERMPLYLFCAGLLFFAIGELIGPGLELFLSFHFPAVVSVSCFLLGHLLLGIGVLLNGGRYPKTWIGIISVAFDVALTAFAFLLIVLLRGVDTALGPVGMELVAGGYAAGMLLMLLCIVASLSATLPLHHRQPQRLLLLAMGLVLVGDEVLRQFTVISWAGSFPFPLLLWTLGYPLLGIAAYWEYADRPRGAGEARDPDEFLSAVNAVVPGLLIAIVTVMLFLDVRGALHSPRALLLFQLFVLLAFGMLARFLLYVASSRLAYLTLLTRLRQSERMSMTDVLTGLANKRACMERLEDELARAARYRRQFAVIFADIDFFKLVNDVHGHQTGDKALIAVGKYLHSSIRTTDMVARLGGEEFVIILPETNVSGAAMLAERLRAGIERISLFTPHGEALRLTISLGIAGHPETSENANDLLKHADEAMQRAKETGRNRVMMAKAKVSVFKAE